MAAKTKAPAQPQALTTIPVGQVQSLIQAHQQQLAQLRLRKGELADELTNVEEAEKRTEGAIFGLSSLLQPQQQAPAPDPGVSPEKTPKPAEKTPETIPTPIEEAVEAAPPKEG